MPKKLIEVALPLEAINRESAREKSIRHGHPSTLHLWWARRPLAAARTVIWASLVDDPSSHPELFPTTEAQNKERKRLFGILERLVRWEDSNDEDLLNEAKAEIMKYTNNNPPELLDPFAGGGAIPLEAQRLGLKAHAHDLNPVAVMINKAMIEIPPKFADKPPINPGDNDELVKKTGWKGCAGLAEDVKYYGEMLKKKAFEKIGSHYPKVKLSDGSEATVIAWLWARTVKCPNPACGCEMPLANSFVLSKKKGKEFSVYPEYDKSTNTINYEVGKGINSKDVPKIGKGAFQCIVCGTTVKVDYIKEESLAGRMNAVMTAVVAEGKKERIYLSPNDEQVVASQMKKPEDYPTGAISNDPRNLWVLPYGLTDFSDLFTNRQLNMLVTFSDLLNNVEEQILNDGGTKEYAQAIRLYLAFWFDKVINYNSSNCSWDSSWTKIRNIFARQAIPMTWDFAEANPFSYSASSFDTITKAINNLPNSKQSEATQISAQIDCGLRNIMVSTDPPYYDNISYADLSDFFYLWLRRNLHDIYPDVLSTMLVPKSDELVATPYRFNNSKQEARKFFENGMLEACKQIYKYARVDFPITIYYAYKQSNTNSDGTASTGWETMLNSIIKAGFTITGTWPMRTEQSNRMNEINSNALASSIVLVCRKREENAAMISKRDFVRELKRELKTALQELQNSNIAPVDMAQSAIGPGMAVFSKYSQVLDQNDEEMSVRTALQIINEELDSYFNEQSEELDRESRFCVELYLDRAFNDIKYGDAEVLAVSKNISIDTLKARGVIFAEKGTVHLIEREELPQFSADENMIWLLTQQLTRAMETGGKEESKILAAQMSPIDAERAKSLAYRLYTVAERKNWNKEAFAYNSLVSDWQEIQKEADSQRKIFEQTNLSL